MANLDSGSEEMAFVQMFIPSETARTTVSALGEIGAVEFLDVIPPIACGHGLMFVVEWGCECLPTQLCQGNPPM